MKLIKNAEIKFLLHFSFENLFIYLLERNQRQEEEKMSCELINSIKRVMRVIFSIEDDSTNLLELCSDCLCNDSQWSINFKSRATRKQ